jgi:hypothetical protein
MPFNAPPALTWLLIFMSALLWLKLICSDAAQLAAGFDLAFDFHVYSPMVEVDLLRCR